MHGLILDMLSLSALKHPVETCESVCSFEAGVGGDFFGLLIASQVGEEVTEEENTK